MAKKRKDDQHTSGFLVRYPEWMRPVLDAIKEKFGQPYTVAARRAMLDYAAKLEIPVPKESEK